MDKAIDESANREHTWRVDGSVEGLPPCRRNRRNRVWKATGLLSVPLLLGGIIWSLYSRSPRAAYDQLTHALEQSDADQFRRTTTRAGRTALFYSRENWLHQEVQEKTRSQLPPLRPLGNYLRRAQVLRVNPEDELQVTLLVRFETGILYRLVFLWTPAEGWRLNNFYQSGTMTKTF